MVEYHTTQIRAVVSSWNESIGMTLGLYFVHNVICFLGRIWRVDRKYEYGGFSSSSTKKIRYKSITRRIFRVGQSESVGIPSESLETLLVMHCPRYRLWVFNILKLSCTLEEEEELRPEADKFIFCARAMITESQTWNRPNLACSPVTTVGEMGMRSAGDCNSCNSGCVI